MNADDPRRPGNHPDPEHPGPHDDYETPTSGARKNLTPDQTRALNNQEDQS